MDTQSVTTARYSRGAVVLHWLIAVLIALNFVAAWVSEDMPKEQAGQIMNNHKAIGITVLLLTLGRIAWRLMHKPPPMVETLKAWEAALARVTHVLLYLLMLAIPLAGWALHSAFTKGAPVSMFGIFAMPGLPVGTDKPTIGMFYELHEITATLMLFLAGLHVAGALKHQFIDKDGTLRRMIPFLR